MKGISTVVATILMLMITIALAGTAYMYINGVFTSKTGIVLSIASADCSMSGGTYTALVLVRNDGTLTASSVTVTATNFNETITSINSGAGFTFPIRNITTVTAGYIKVTASATGVSSATGNMFCP